MLGGCHLIVCRRIQGYSSAILGRVRGYHSPDDVGRTRRASATRYNSCSWRLVNSALLALVLGCSTQEQWALRRVSTGSSVPDGGQAVPDSGVVVDLQSGLIGVYSFEQLDARRLAYNTNGLPAADGRFLDNASLSLDAGLRGNALLSTDGGVSIPRHSGDAYTFSVWFKASGPVVGTEFTAGGRLFTFLRGGNGAAAALSALIPGDGSESVWLLFNEVKRLENERIFVGNVRLDAQTWHHLAVAYQPDTQTLRTLLDGQLSVKTSLSITGGPPNDLAVGYLPSVDDRAPAYFPGALDEFSIWKRALSADELTALWERR
jgi:Concanavalin A-like lectin/glucanases superfamily